MSNLSIDQKKQLRTLILMQLQKAYPGRIHVKQLRSGLVEERSYDVGVDLLLAEVNYLAEKQLLQMEKPKSVIRGEDPSSWIVVKVTPRGIDYLEGSIQEVGLASPELYL